MRKFFPVALGLGVLLLAGEASASRALRKQVPYTSADYDGTVDAQAQAQELEQMEAQLTDQDQGDQVAVSRRESRNEGRGSAEQDTDDEDVVDGLDATRVDGSRYDEAAGLAENQADPSGSTEVEASILAKGQALQSQSAGVLAGRTQQQASSVCLHTLVAVSDPAWRVLVFSVFSLIYVAALVASIRGIWLGRVSNQLRATLGFMQKKISSWGCTQEDDVRQLLQRHTLDSKVKNLRLIMQVMFFALVPSTVVIPYKILTSAERTNWVVTDVLAMVFMLIVLCPVLFPAVVSRRTLDIFYGVLMIVSALTPWVFTDVQRAYGIGAANFATLVLTWVRRTGGPWESLRLILLNVGFATSTAVRYPWLTVPQFAAMTIITLGAFLLEQSLQTSLLNCLQYEEAKEMLAAASALLNSCCEVVVELNSQGVITTGGADLGSFLLRGPSSSLEGCRLEELLFNLEERQLFSERLSAPKLRDLGLAENMPVSMKDANGTLLRLELMWFQFHRLDGKQHYRVGIREFADSMAAAHPRGQSPGDLSNVRAESSFSEGTSVTSSRSLLDPDPTLVLDSSTHDLCIRVVSPEFAARVGRLPLNTAFVRHLKNPMRFLSWLQAEGNRLHSGGDEEPAVSCAITLHMPHGKLKAICHIEGGEGLDIERVVVRFSRIRRQQEPADSRAECASGGGQRWTSRGTPITHIML